MNYWSRWSVVGLYAVAMAWVEAAVVFYLRTHVDRIQPYQPNPLPDVAGFAEVELARELATLLMLFTVGWLAGSSWQGRFGYMGIAFGVWDIFYYLFLKVMTGWPNSLADWDILFLIPLPWWGPVWAPTSIAVLMIFWGTLVTRPEHEVSSPAAYWTCITIGAVGIALALYVFMADSLPVAAQGADALRKVLPNSFNWPMFLAALALMAAPVLSAARVVVRQQSSG